MRAFFHRHYPKIHSRPWLRNSLGFSLVVGGVLGPFLPLLGLWMLPLGLVLLSTDFPWALRLHRKLESRFARYWRKPGAHKP